MAFDVRTEQVDTVGSWENLPVTVMEMYTGRPVDLVSMMPEDVDWVDVVHALANICRYGGHCRRFYSVAEHSIHCHDEAVRLGVGWELRLACLMHDAGEAYCNDMIRPMKRAPGMGEYLRYSGMAQRVVEDRLPNSNAEIDWGFVRMVDNRVLKAESVRLMQSKGRPWKFLRELEPARISPLKWWWYGLPGRARAGMFSRLKLYVGDLK